MIFRRNKNEKTFVTFGKLFTIRKLSQLDFLESDGMPLSLFIMTGTGGKDASKSIFKALKTEDEKKKDLDRQHELVKKVLDIAIVKPEKFSTKSLKWPEAFALYAIILDFSLCRFKRIYEVSKNMVVTIDALAKRYGKTPLEMLCPTEKFSDFETNMFNTFIGVNALIIEIEAKNKAADEQRRLNAKAGRK